jgi:hypothetical protein
MSVLISQVHVIPTLAFVLVSMPSTYKLTAGLLGSWLASSERSAQDGRSASARRRVCPARVIPAAANRWTKLR